jgi:hypothetical protein
VIQSTIGRSVLSSIGVATLAILSLFGNRAGDPGGQADRSYDPAGRAKDQNIACTNREGKTVPCSVGGVRG